jgi:hypothetical protein
LWEIIKAAILNQDEIKIVCCFTSANYKQIPARMRDFEKEMGVNVTSYELKLLTVDNMVTITNQLIDKFKIQVETQDNSVYRQFLSAILGNPTHFGDFLSTCSQFPFDDMTHSFKSYIPFSIKGFSNFVIKNYFNNKEVVWKCLNSLSRSLECLGGTLNGMFFVSLSQSLSRIRERECLLSLMDVVLNNVTVERRTPLRHSTWTFSDLEKDGVVFGPLSRK